MSFLAAAHGCQLKEQKRKSVIVRRNAVQSGNPENNNFHSISCYFFPRLLRSFQSQLCCMAQ
ncbi:MULTISPECIES: hypothetical protein [unclassified Rickettsia]|uniref:hypothetical protein n=1 Tax=unclassified Rickettsia TaxID=114295 RepID=UPI003133075B